MCVKCKERKQLKDHKFCGRCLYKALKKGGTTIDGVWLDFWYVDKSYINGD
jgi:hypothetical protein